MAKPTLQPMPRLPKEPSPDMMRTFGPRPSPEELRSGADPIASPSPSDYRQTNPHQAPPAEYKAPSLLREHRRLAILFAGVAAAFAVYCLRLPHRARSAAAPTTASGPSTTVAPSAAQPIYIESVPDKDSR
jgi:hypothetical protein